MKKRIGNDIHFTWTVKRKNGELLTPEDFTGKECVVELIDDYHRRCVIDNVVFGEGTVSWTFWGKDQRATGAYTAVLSENRGAEGMVTIDTVKAVVLVSHSYQEEDDDAEGVIEAESVELESEISAGGSTPVDAYTKAQTDALLAEKQDVVEDLDTIRSGADAGATAYQKPQTGIPSTDMSSAVQTSLGKADTALQTETDPTVPAWAKAQNKPTYTAQEVGALPDNTTIPSALSDLTDDATHRTVTDTEKTSWNNKVNRNSPSVIEPLIVMENGGDYWTTVTSDDVVVNQKFDGTSTPISLKSLAATVGDKADKVSGATNGNFAALDSNGNLTDSGHKHGDYLTDHQDLSNYVQKSNTQGLLKNDGTVDTTQYLSQHQDISGKADKSEMSVVPGTGANADKTTITLKQGTSATVLTAHKDITGKEDITPIVQVASGTTAINASVNTYYEVAGEVGVLAITLPTPPDLTKVSMVVVHLTAGTNPNVVIGSAETIDYSASYDISAGGEYEINCLYNGDKWIVADMEVV